MSNVAVLTLYLLCALGCWQLIRKDVREEGAPLRLPGERVLPFLACGVIVWVLSSATAPELAVTGAVVAIASVLYLLRRARDVAPRSA